MPRRWRYKRKWDLLESNLSSRPFKQASLKSIMNIYRGWVPGLNMAGVRTLTVWLMEPVAISFVMALSWARPPMSRGKVNFTALLKEGWRTTGTLLTKLLHKCKSSLMVADRPRASLASPNIFIVTSDSQPFRMTDVTHAFGKFRVSSTFWPFTSLKLWRTLKSFNSCGRTLWRRSRTPSSTQQMLEPVWWHDFSFFLCCLGTSSLELSMEELCCHFLGVTVGEESVEDEVVAAGSLAGGDGFMGGESNCSGGSLFGWS